MSAAKPPVRWPADLGQRTLLDSQLRLPLSRDLHAALREQAQADGQSIGSIVRYAVVVELERRSRHP